MADAVIKLGQLPPEMRLITHVKIKCCIFTSHWLEANCLYKSF
jgi:hypothetical protein